MAFRSIRALTPLASSFRAVSAAPNLTRAFSIHNTAQIGKPAPGFKATALVNGNAFEELSLEDFKGKYVVLAFYPLDWTFACPSEIVAHNDNADKFKALNTEVIVASVDSHFSHHAWANHPRSEGGLAPMTIPMLSDIDRSISSAYGCLGDEGFTFRASYIIDDQGILRHIQISDRPVGRSVAETLRLVEAFQFTDKHGEVCPADWQSGGDTIKPDVEGKLEYFGKVNK